MKLKRYNFAFLLLLVLPLAVEAHPVELCNKSRLRYRNLTDQAITKVAPSYPNERGMRMKGNVIVLINVDPYGDVVSARMVCGHPLLAASSVSAAMRWKFRPRRVHGRRVRSIGTITFEFPWESKLS